MPKLTALTEPATGFWGRAEYLAVETPSFTFRLERIRSLRERAEESAQEDLAHELRLRLRGEAMLLDATQAASAATQTGRNTVTSGSSGTDLIAAQAYIERAERARREAALDLDRRDVEVAARRVALQAAARDRQVLDKLKQRQHATTTPNGPAGPRVRSTRSRSACTAAGSQRERRRRPRSGQRAAADDPAAPRRPLPRLDRLRRPAGQRDRDPTAIAGPPALRPRLRASRTGASELPADIPFGAEITAAAKKHGIDPALLAGLVKQESGFNPNAGSPAGARGLTQLMPGTAAGLGVTNVLDPVQSLDGGAKYLRAQLDAFGGDVTKALAAYNAGPGAVQRYGGVPPYAETQNYVRAVQANAAAYRAASPTPSIL